jgi:hypothetical protein
MDIDGVDFEHRLTHPREIDEQGRDEDAPATP